MDTSGLTHILEKARAGDSEAKDAVLPMVYQELRAIARRRMKSGAEGTLQPTALVHEAYVRSLASEAGFESRRHFFFVAARAMRDILVEHARRKGRIKHGGDVEFAPNEDVAAAISSPVEDMIALNDALERLEQEHPRSHNLVMLRFFGGLDLEESAKLLEISRRTADRDWQFARAYLYDLLSDSSEQ